MLCPELIGRDSETAGLGHRVDALSDRRGGLVAIVGDAGAGKSRLVADALADADVVALAGRAVAGDSPVPYRPLAEALLTHFRTNPLPDDPTLDGFEGHLARLVPSWAANTTADNSPVLLGEAVARLLSVLAGDRGCVLLLEDVHWADAESLAVLDYLGETLAGGSVLCVCTARPRSGADQVLERLARRDPGAVVHLDRLREPDVTRMVSRCLGVADAPAGLSGFVHEHSDGSPFLVEELLAGLVAAGALAKVDAAWEITGPLTPAVPASLRDSIQSRLSQLDPSARRVLGAAALLGRSFEWELLPGIAEVDGRAAVDTLRAAVDGQLIEAEGDGFRFRHALTREAILADLLPPERRDLAGRAWPTIERANPGLPGATCQLAADLAAAAGDPLAAAERLIECARRALDDGALATAEATARRARDVALGSAPLQPNEKPHASRPTRTAEPITSNPPTAIDADEMLVHILAAAGKSDEALVLGRSVAKQLAATNVPPTRQVDLLIALVRAGIAQGNLDEAARAAQDARTAAGADGDVDILTKIDAAAAEVALDRADLDEGERLARRALEGARLTHQPEVICQSLLVLGRVLRPLGVADASVWFQEAADVAAEAGLARWHLRAQQELALEAWVEEGAPALESTRALAARYGAHLTVAVMDLAIADLALSNYDTEACRRAATACVDASRRYRLATESVAQLWLAGAYALNGDEAAMRDAIDAALVADPADPRILGDLYGRVLMTRAFIRDELDTLPDLADTMIEHVRAAPSTTSVYPGRILWALLHTVHDDDLGASERLEYHETTGRLGLPTFSYWGEVIEAVALGRSGDPEGADRKFERAYGQLTAFPPGQGMTRAGLLVVAPAAIRDGWGDPVRWLRDGEAWFAERGFDRLVRRSRALLGDAGAPVPRRGRGDSSVPQRLRALGVTSREMDVLKLVVEGNTNKQIAAELHLSPKTVERHLSSLFSRTGVRNRQALAQFCVRGTEPPSGRS